MADDESIRQLEARLTRLESALSQHAAATAGFTPPGGAVVDPAPWGGGGGWGGAWRWPHPHPIVDSATFAASQWAHPRPVVDPAPWPTPVVDPAVFAGAAQAAQARSSAAATLGRIGQIGDPPPIDVSRFTIAQLEATLHSINAERARLASMETMVNQQLNKLKQQGPQQT